MLRVSGSQGTSQEATSRAYDRPCIHSLPPSPPTRVHHSLLQYPSSSRAISYGPDGSRASSFVLASLLSRHGTVSLFCLPLTAQPANNAASRHPCFAFGACPLLQSLSVARPSLLLASSLALPQWLDTSSTHTSSLLLPLGLRLSASSIYSTFVLFTPRHPRGNGRARTYHPRCSTVPFFYPTFLRARSLSDRARNMSPLRLFVSKSLY